MQTLKMKINIIITITINHTTEDRIQRMIMMRTTTNSNSHNTIKRDIKDLNREEITITTMNRKKKIERIANPLAARAWQHESEHLLCKELPSMYLQRLRDPRRRLRAHTVG